MIERVHVHAVEAERLWKERDDLLRAIEGLRTECDLARHECVNAQQRIDLLEGELEGERDLKVKVEGMFARLIVEVGQREEEVQCLEAEETQQHEQR